MSGTVEHTPGPWDWKVGEDTLVGRAGVVVIQYESYEGMSFNDYDRSTPETSDANRSLIAAAPELLAALKAVLDSNKVHDDWALNQAIRAIARAEGRDA